MRRVAGLVLAAGASTRMGPETNKLLAEIGGEALVTWPVDALRGAGVGPVFVVVGHDAPALRSALAQRPVRFVRNDAWREGMAGSIACGAREIESSLPTCEGVLVVLGDLPRLRSEHVRPLLEAFDSCDDDAICVAVHAGQRGHPVLFGEAHLRELAGLRGAHGARGLLERHADSIVEVEIASDAVLADVDTPEALADERRPR